MKKKVCMALLGLMVLGVTACGKEPVVEQTVTVETAVSSDVVEEEPVEEVVEEEEEAVEEPVEEMTETEKIAGFCYADSRRLKTFMVTPSEGSEADGTISFANVYSISDTVQIQDNSYPVESIFVPKEDIWTAVEIFIKDMDCDLEYLHEEVVENVEVVEGEEIKSNEILYDEVSETVTAGSRSLADFKGYNSKVSDGKERGFDTEEYYVYDFVFKTQSEDSFEVRIETKNADGSEVLSYEYNLVTPDHSGISDTLFINATDGEPLYFAFTGAGCDDESIDYSALSK